MPSMPSKAPPSSLPAAPAASALRPALVVGAVAVILDQLSKWWILTDILPTPDVIPLTGFLNLVLVCNPGISFGLFPGDSALKPWILSAVALAISVGLLVWVRRKADLMVGLAAGLVAGGALGNVVDRLRFGCVVDFIDVHAAGFHWPAFNVADSAITVGVVLLMVHGLFFERHQSK